MSLQIVVALSRLSLLRASLDPARPWSISDPVVRVGFPTGMKGIAERGPAEGHLARVTTRRALLIDITKYVTGID